MSVPPGRYSTTTQQAREGREFWPAFEVLFVGILRSDVPIEAPTNYNIKRENTHENLKQNQQATYPTERWDPRVKDVCKPDLYSKVVFGKNKSVYKLVHVWMDHKLAY